MRMATTSDVVRIRPPLPAANAPVAAKSRALVQSARRLIPIVACLRSRAANGSTERLGAARARSATFEKAQVGLLTMDPVYPSSYNVHVPIKKLNLRRKRSWVFADSRGLSRRWLSPVPARSLSGLAGAARAADVVVPGATDFPESMSASSDGTLYFSSFGNGRVWRAKPGEAQASEFIKTGSNGLASALGVLADDKSNTLYVCSDDFSAGGIKIPGASMGTSLKLFDLKSGEAKGSIRRAGANDLVQ